MAIWEKPPTDAYDGLKNYLNATYPDQSVSISCDANRKLTQIDMPNLSDTDMSILIMLLQSNFPGAF